MQSIIYTASTDSGTVALMTGNRNCTSFGPVGEGVHQPDEYVVLSSVLTVQTVLEKLLDKMVFGEEGQ